MTRPPDVISQPVGLVENRFTKHGPVRVQKGKTYLSHADGTPFFYLADTVWNGPLLSNDADWETYLDDRAAKGFTAIQFISHAPWTAALTDADGEVAFTGDPARPLNAKFYDRMDRKMAAINARGMLAVPVLAWAANFGASSKLNIGHTAGADELIRLVGAQVERLKHHQVMWILAGDGRYGCLKSRKWKRVGRAVFGGKEHAPVAMHPMGMHWPYGWFRNEDWLDVWGYQSSHSEHEKTIHWLNAGPMSRVRGRPVINLEPVYERIAPEGRPFDNAAVRRACYRSLLNAPTAGIAYGVHGLWGWHDRPTETLNHPGMGVGPSWCEAMNFPGSQDMARLAKVFTSIKWWTLTQAINWTNFDMLIDDSGENHAYFSETVRYSDTGDLVTSYSPTGDPIGAIKDLVRPDLNYWWINPRESIPPAAAKLQSSFPPCFPTPEIGKDWLLIGATQPLQLL